MARTLINMTWADREIPILEAIRDAEDSDKQPFYIDSQLISQSTGLDYEVVCQSLRRLASADYIDMRDTSTHDGTSYHSIALAERGLRTVGPWPPEETFESLRSLIEEMIAKERDAERRSRLQKLLGSLMDVGKDAAGSLLGAWLKQVAGL